MSDSTTSLTIGDETFAVVSRSVLEGAECPSGEPHTMYLVETEGGGKFHVCDDCSLSKQIERPES